MECWNSRRGERRLYYGEILRAIGLEDQVRFDGLSRGDKIRKESFFPILCFGVFDVGPPMRDWKSKKYVRSDCWWRTCSQEWRKVVMEHLHNGGRRLQSEFSPGPLKVLAFWVYDWALRETHSRIIWIRDLYDGPDYLQTWLSSGKHNFRICKYKQLQEKI